jgi:hypothetical protein
MFAWSVEAEPAANRTQITLLIISCNIRGEADLALEHDLALDLAAMSSAAPTRPASAEKTTGAVAASAGKPAVFDNLKAYEL